MEWIQYGRTWKDFEEEFQDLRGIQVEVNDCLYLIGDINQQGGECDDCMPFRRRKDIVTRYRRLLNPEDIGD